MYNDKDFISRICMTFIETGLLRCKAKNQFGNYSHEFKIIVTGKIVVKHLYK